MAGHSSVLRITWALVDRLLGDHWRWLREILPLSLSQFFSKQNPYHAMKQKTIMIGTLAITGISALIGTAAIGTAAAKLPHRQAAAEHALPLLATAALAAACLGTAAAGASDLCSRNHKQY